MATTMTLHGTLNHVSITVSNLDEAMAFFGPFLEFFGYTVGTPSPYAGTRLTVNVNEGNGIAINVWEAKEQHPFKVYEPGLHHIAINAGSKAQVDAALQIVRRAGLKVLDGPGEFPFAIGGYYAFYFLGPDDLKFEVVYMASLDVQSR
jgi:catechol 2,3-dioxygenase-like lactoylglutathione lyase family enzyme